MLPSHSYRMQSSYRTHTTESCDQQLVDNMCVYGVIKAYQLTRYADEAKYVRVSVCFCSCKCLCVCPLQQICVLITNTVRCSLTLWNLILYKQMQPSLFTEHRHQDTTSNEQSDDNQQTKAKRSGVRCVNTNQTGVRTPAAARSDLQETNKATIRLSNTLHLNVIITEIIIYSPSRHYKPIRRNSDLYYTTTVQEHTNQALMLHKSVITIVQGFSQTS